LTVWDGKRLAAPHEVEIAEAITDWVAVVREELLANGEIPILTIALAELVRRYEQVKKSGMNDLAEAVGKYLADCAAAVLKAEDKSRSGSNGGSRSL
jgi:hypothetical protein